MLPFCEALYLTLLNLLFCVHTHYQWEALQIRIGTAHHWYFFFLLTYIQYSMSIYTVYSWIGRYIGLRTTKRLTTGSIREREKLEERGGIKVWHAHGIITIYLLCKWEERKHGGENRAICTSKDDFSIKIKKRFCTNAHIFHTFFTFSQGIELHARVVRDKGTGQGMRHIDGFSWALWVPPFRYLFS